MTEPTQDAESVRVVPLSDVDPMSPSYKGGMMTGPTQHAETVWAVFFVSDETLHWELDSIHADFASADACLKRIAEEDPHLEGLKTLAYPLRHSDGSECGDER